MRCALLMYLDPRAARETTPEDAAAELRAYGAVTDRMAAAGVLRGGEALLPAQTARRVRVSDDEAETASGPAVAGDLELAGWYVLEVADLDEAVRWAAEVPVASHGAVEIRPVLDLPTPGTTPGTTGSQPRHP